MTNFLIISTNNISIDNRLLKNISILEEKNKVDIFGLDLKNTHDEIKKNNDKKIYYFSISKFLKNKKTFQKKILEFFFKIFYIKRLFILFQYSKYIKKNLKFHQYAYIWLQDFDCAILYFFLYKKIDFKKVIFDAHELYQYSFIRNAKYKKPVSFFIKLIFKFFFKSVDLFVTINTGILKFYKLNYKFKKSCKFVVLNNSFYTKIKKENDKINLSLKKKLHIEENKKILLYSGIVHPWRGIDLLFKIAKILNNKDFVIVIIGFGSHYDFYKSKILEEKINNVIIHPAMPYHELPFWFKEAYIGTMLFENIDLNHKLCSPNKLWEYASASIPFISFDDFKQLKKFDEKYNIGFFVNSSDSAEKISSFIENISDDELMEKKKNLEHFTNVTDYRRQFNEIIQIINNQNV